MTDAMAVCAKSETKTVRCAKQPNELSIREKGCRSFFLQTLRSIAKYLLATFVMARARQVIRKLIECEV